MKLAHYQIDQLKEYISTQSIWYEDVREEILDHVASIVEEKMTEEDVSFVNASAEAFNELDIHKFQRAKLLAEHKAVLKEVLREMKSFLSGTRLIYLATLVSFIGFIFSINADLTQEIWPFAMMGPILLMVYFIAIPTYLRKYRVLYLSYYFSRINGIYLPTMFFSSLITWADDWLLSRPLWCIAITSFYFLYVASGLLIMNRTLKKVKVRAAQY